MDPDSRNKNTFKEKKKSIFTNINSENLLKNIFQVSVNSVVVAILNLVFHFIMSRRLGPEQYGELETLLTINTIVLITLSAVCLIVTRFISYYRTRQQYDKMKFLANWAFIFFFIIGMAIFVLNIIMSRIISAFLNITDYYMIIIFGLLIWISFLMPIIEGILRGLQEFSYVGKYKLLDAALRLLIAGSLVLLAFGIRTIVAGLIVGASITLVFSAYILRKVYINKPYKIEFRDIYRFAIPVFLACIAFAVISNIDLILVKHFFDAKTTGNFAAAAMLAKVLLSMAFGSAGVMFPKIVEFYSNGDTKNIIKTFRNTLKIFLIGGLILTLAMAIFPHEISGAFFGKQYDVGDILGLYVFATLFLSLVSILMMYDLAVKRYGFIMVFLAAAAVMIYQIVQLHSTVFDILWALFIIDGLLAIFMIIYNHKAIFARYE